MEVHSYVRVNPLSAVYRVAKIKGDQARCVPAPERTDGAAYDRVWVPLADLIFVAPPSEERRA